MSSATVRASTATWLSTGGALQTIAFPGTPQVGDPIGIWVTVTDNTKQVTATPTGWTLEYSAAFGTATRVFLHKIYEASDGASVALQFNAQPNGMFAVVVLDGLIHSGFGTIGTINEAVGSDHTTATAPAAGTAAKPNLVVIHEKSGSTQTSCTVDGATDIINQMPPATRVGTVYIGTYDDSAGPADKTATYGTVTRNTSAYQVPVFVASTNTPPVADAGPDQTVAPWSTVTLDGSASSDADAGDTLTYAWTQTAGPAVALSDSTAVEPTFDAPPSMSEQTLTFSLVVTDSAGTASAADTVDVVIAQATEAYLTGGEWVPMRTRTSW